MRKTKCFEKKFWKKVIFVAIMNLFLTLFSEWRGIYPNKKWLMFKSPEEAGWSSSKLYKAKQLYNSLGSSALMVIYKGAVLIAWGDYERRFWCHSIRKSILSALYGPYVHTNKINLYSSLEDLTIDDISPLSATEKKATVFDLLRARSGVYHPAAYETRSMKKSRPRRHSHKPGSFWYYNNWDFNTLLTVFEKETGEKFFEAFQSKISSPLQMQDFRISDTYYHYERYLSRHPAYPFRLSTRDMARFGLLILNRGRWRNQTIIPEEWIIQSSKIYSQTGWRRGGYGFLWWINQQSFFKDLGMISAIGAGGKHRIDVLPGADLVFVYRFNTYKRGKLTESETVSLLKMILDSKTEKEIKPPALVLLPEIKKKFQYKPLHKNVLAKYHHEFKLNSGFRVRVYCEGSDLMLYSPEMGKFKLLALSGTEFTIEDMLGSVVFQCDGLGDPVKITINYPSGLVEWGSPVKSLVGH